MMEKKFFALQTLATDILEGCVVQMKDVENQRQVSHGYCFGWLKFEGKGKQIMGL